MGSVIKQPIYPTMDNLDEAEEFIAAQLPITSTNTLHSMLMLYQNTILEVQRQQEESNGRPFLTASK